MTHCIVCAAIFNEHGFCPSCHQRPIEIFENSPSNYIGQFCSECGNYLDDDEQFCPNCDFDRNEIKSTLNYSYCPKHDEHFDSYYGCPVCQNFTIYTKQIEYRQGQMSFINKRDCPVNLMPKEHYFDKKSKLNYKRLSGGQYTVSTQPMIILDYNRNHQPQRINLAKKIMDFTGWIKMSKQRAEKLQKFLPPTFSLEDVNGETQIAQPEFEHWLKKCK